MTRTIIVFLEYKDSEKWFGRELLSDGKILYACNDTINVVTYREKEPDYNEIIIVKYAENTMCDDAVERLNQFASKLKSYKVFQVKPYPQSQINLMNKGIKNGATSKTKNQERVDLDELPVSFKRVFSTRDTSRPYIMLFFNKYRDVPIYPEDYKGERKKTGLEAYMEYGKHASKYQGGVKASMYLVAKFKKTIVSDIDEEWDMLALARYPTLAHFKKMVTTPTFGDRGIHYQAGLERNVVWGTFPYEEFT